MSVINDKPEEKVIVECPTCGGEGCSWCKYTGIVHVSKEYSNDENLLRVGLKTKNEG